MITAFKSGAHAHRTPLSYPALQPLFQDHITFVHSPDAADVLIFAHSLDILNAPFEIIASWRQHQQPVILLSEEPFWDTIWGRQPGLRQRVVDTAHGPLPVVQLTHQTSDIFAFEKIPYYLLTNHRFAVAYASRFKRNAKYSAQDWQQRFRNYAQDIVFMFERRPEAHHNAVWPAENIVGLCAWRTEVAEGCRSGKVQRLGHSWASTTPKRQECIDWHLDKLIQLDGHQRILAAFENTHQPLYLSEKFFDAFACGAIPAYFASPHHHIHRLSLPQESWINCFGARPQAASQQIINSIELMQQLPIAEAYVQAQHRLAELFSAPAVWYQERLRLRKALLAEFNKILSSASQCAL